MVSAQGRKEASKSWWGGRSFQKHFDIPKKFSGYTTFFRQYEKHFPDIPKNFPGYMKFFP
jgi:hypothetical protein